MIFKIENKIKYLREKSLALQGINQASLKYP